MLISLPVLCALALIGLVLGTLSACAGARLDRVLTVICDTFISFPALIIAVAIIGVWGNGLKNIAIAVIVSMWAWFARTVLAYALVEMGKLYQPGPAGIRKHSSVHAKALIMWVCAFVLRNAHTNRT